MIANTGLSTSNIHFQSGSFSSATSSSGKKRQVSTELVERILTYLVIVLFYYYIEIVLVNRIQV
jgi:hypothetical protein